MIVNANGHCETTSRVTLLWENPAPLPDGMPAQTTIELDISKYKLLYVLSIASDTYQYVDVSVLINDSSIERQCIQNKNGLYVGMRAVTLTSNTITFDVGILLFPHNDFTSWMVGGAQFYVIPYRIYGVI